jgi:glycosyltransferase involved in cell wall biosynthesis
MSPDEEAGYVSEPEAESLSVVIPVYRTEAVLPELYRQLVDSLEKIGAQFEIVFIEDCGGDRSWEVIEDLALRDARVRGLKMGRNYGQHNAVLCGIRAARNDIIVTMDDDLQHPPDQIGLLLAGLRGGCDVVYGVPQTEQHGLLRDIASRLTKLALQSTMGVENARNVSAFRAFRTTLRDAFENYRSPAVSIDVLLSWSTRAFGVVKVKHLRRFSGASNYTLGKLINYAFNLMTGFSTLPLRLVSLVGFAFTLFGLCVLTWVLAAYMIYGSVVPGFVFLATIIAIFSGVQLFALGIFGEYLARIFGRTMDKPTYVIRKSTTEPEESGHTAVRGRVS